MCYKGEKSSAYGSLTLKGREQITSMGKASLRKRKLSNIQRKSGVNRIRSISYYAASFRIWVRLGGNLTLSGLKGDGGGWTSEKEKRGVDGRRLGN